MKRPTTRATSQALRALLLLAVVLACAACSSQDKQKIRIAIGTQDTTINCAAGGLLIRELKLLEKHLPRDGKYKDVEFEIVWKDFTSGPPLTTEMVAEKLDIGAMADFPGVLNGVAFQKQGSRSQFIATLSGSPLGSGNGVVVPLDSPVTSLKDLKGKQISVPFGSSAHGMLLRAVRDLGWDPDKDVTLVSQSPEVGGSSLKANKIDAHADFVPFAELFPFRGFARKIYDGASVKVPTAHGVLVRAAYAEQHPEIVVAFLKASLEADRLFTEEPEKYSELIEKVTGVDAEVAYMFHGPLGIQTRDFTIKPEVRRALQVAVDTLTLLKRTDTALDVGAFVDERYIRRAAEELGIDYEARLQSYAKLPLSGGDALTGEPIDDPALAAQLWVAGEPKVRAYRSPANALAARRKLLSEGKEIRAAFVHDRASGVKLLADRAWYTRRPDGSVSAFLGKEDAEAWAAAASGGAAVLDLASLERDLAKVTAAAP
ncbi:ABC transporter substrate-binding protein [Sorangium sp. So ce131]|uniref:ABC transporter substrate-binding protein n=1 Tax=Sorangium sp. So ce131 TaxID=3133282 RepID=UPI003F61FB63